MVYFLVAGLVGLAVGRLLAVQVGVGLKEVTAAGAFGRRPGCDCRVAALDIPPVLWWLRSPGACAGCERRVDPLYPSVELVTAAVFVAAQHFLGLSWSLPAYLWFVSLTVVLGFIDLRTRTIPNRILLPGTAIGLILLAAGAALDGRIGDLPEALATGAGYFVVLLVASMATRGAIGMGDVKLAFLLGLFAGYETWEAGVTAFAGAFVLAGLVAVLLIAFRVLTRNDYLPFGPFMIAAAWVAIAREVVAGAGLA